MGSLSLNLGCSGALRKKREQVTAKKRSMLGRLGSLKNEKE